MTTLPAPLPADAAPALNKLTLVPIDGDYMLPSMRNGDFAVAVPCERFLFDALYVVEIHGKPLVYRCQRHYSALPALKILMKHDAFDGHVVDDRDFNASVLGYVCGHVKAIDAQAMRTGRMPQTVGLEFLR